MNKRLVQLYLLSMVLSTACQKNNSMADLLEEVANRSFFVPQNDYASSVRVRYFDSLMQEVPPFEQPAIKLRKAEALLYGGQTPEAIHMLEELYQLRNTQRVVPGLSDYDEDRIDDLLALAYLRLGEQQNCIIKHSSASCIFPIQQDGVHQLPEGSENAIKLLEQILEGNPRDLHNRWLLNVAYMTLGRYPDQVPEKWLIPQKALLSDHPLKKFTDKAPELGVDVNSLSGGCIIDDFNNDYYPDIMLSSWFPDEPVRLFLNQGSKGFEEVSEIAGLDDVKGGLNLIQADYNNDGLLDVLVLRGGWLGKLGKQPNSLLKNNGMSLEGYPSFTDVTIEAGLLSYHPTQTATWNDFNNDGWLDLFIGNESSSQDDVHSCELFINQKNGRFKDVAKYAGIEVSNTDSVWYYVKGVTSGDYDGDGDADIFISTLGGDKANLLYRNEGVDTTALPVFNEVAGISGLEENISSFPTWFFDYNNDGWPDLFVAGYNRQGDVISSITHDVTAEYLNLPHTAETMRLYRNNKDGTFTDVSAQLGLNKIGYAMGANFGDLDNDGFLDIYLSTGEVNFASIIPNRMFRNNAGTAFQDVTSAGGFGHLQKGHAVSFADWDMDGDQDIYTVMGGAYEGDGFQNVFFQNPYQEEANWISIKLEGHKTNRSAIGTKVVVFLEDNGREQMLARVINSGGSFGSSPLWAHIGLGNAQKITRIEVIWGRSETQIFYDVAINQRIKISEGEESFEIISVPKLYIPSSDSQHAHP